MSIPRGEVHRRGFTIVYASVVLVALLAIASLAVDYVRVQLVRTQLRTVAEAAALYGAKGMATSVSQGQSNAIAAAADNKVDGTAYTLSSSDIEFGLWDPDVHTFTPLTGTARNGATAIRVTTRANGYSIPFARIVGRSTIDIGTQVVASIGENVSENIPATGCPWLAGMPNGSTVTDNTYHHTSTAPANAPTAISITVTPGQKIYFRDNSGQTGDTSTGHTYGLDGDTTRPNMAQASANHINTTTAPLSALMGIFLNNNRPTLNSTPFTTPDFSSSTAARFQQPRAVAAERLFHRRRVEFEQHASILHGPHRRDTPVPGCDGPDGVLDGQHRVGEHDRLHRSAAAGPITRRANHSALHHKRIIVPQLQDSQSLPCAGAYWISPLMCKALSTNRRGPRRHGVAVVYAICVMVAMLALSSLAVDYARMRVARTQLQAAADAAAMYGAKGISPGLTAAQNNAIASAADNKVDGSVYSLSSSDIDLGVWDPTSRTFTVLTGAATASADAIRINAQECFDDVLLRNRTLEHHRPRHRHRHHRACGGAGDQCDGVSLARRDAQRVERRGVGRQHAAVGRAGAVAAPGHRAQHHARREVEFPPLQRHHRLG